MDFRKLFSEDSSILILLFLFFLIFVFNKEK